MHLSLVLFAWVTAAPPAFVASKESLEILEKAERALAAAPDDQGAIVQAALARKMAGRYEEALELLVGCKQVKCGMALAILASMSDDAWRMRTFYTQWTSAEQPPEDLAAAHRFHSQALVRMGRFDDAVAAARASIAAQDAPMMHLDLAVALFAAGKYDEAEKELDGALVKMPNQPATLYWKYRCLAQRNDPKLKEAAKRASEALLESVTGKLQDRGDLHYLLAEVSKDLGDEARERTHREIASRMHVTQHWAPAKAAGERKAPKK